MHLCEDDFDQNEKDTKKVIEPVVSSVFRLITFLVLFDGLWFVDHPNFECATRTQSNVFTFIQFLESDSKSMTRNEVPEVWGV